jgi:hypothetical protein
MAANELAKKIAKGEVEEKEWEFLTWLQQPVSLEGSRVVAATSAKKKSSGSKKPKAESASPSTPNHPPTSLMDITLEPREEGA